MELDRQRLKTAVIDWLLDLDDLEPLPDGITILCFHLYRGTRRREPWRLELIGTSAVERNGGFEEEYIPRIRSCRGFELDGSADAQEVLDAAAGLLREAVAELDFLQILEAERLYAVGEGQTLLPLR